MNKTPALAAKIAAIRAQLARSCTVLNGVAAAAGTELKGVAAAAGTKKNWLGRVNVCRPEETAPPLDVHGKPLYPLAQIYLADLAHVPEQLRRLHWLTLFIGADIPPSDSGLCRPGHGWLIREYGGSDGLINHQYAEQGWPKALALQPEARAIDMPLWDGGGVPAALEREICALEADYPAVADANHLDYFDDICRKGEHCYGHKLGGYPSYCQPGLGLEFAPGYEFVLQISSDDQADFNVIDSGSLMFARHATRGDWLLYYDFY